MNKTYTLFIIGFLTAIPIPVIDNLDEIDEPQELEEFGDHPVESYIHFLKSGAKIWEFSYLILLAVSIPIRIIPSLKTRLPQKALFVLDFMAGQSFGFVIIKIISFSL